MKKKELRGEEVGLPAVMGTKGDEVAVRVKNAAIARRREPLFRGHGGRTEGDCGTAILFCGDQKTSSGRFGHMNGGSVETEILSE